MEINEYIKLFENIESNNNRINELESIVNYRKLYDNMNCENYISEINQLYKFNEEIYNDIKSFDIKIGDTFTVENYIEIDRNIQINNDKLKELDGLISMRNALGRDCSTYVEQYNQILSENAKLNQQLSSYDIDISKDKANLIYDRYISKQKIFTIGKNISKNININSENFSESFKELKNEINKFNVLNENLNKINMNEKVALLSDKRHNVRKLEDLKQLLNEKNLQLNLLAPDSYEYSKCKGIIKSLKNDLDATSNILNEIELREKNYFDVNDLSKPLKNKFEKNTQEKNTAKSDSSEKENLEINKKVSEENYFKNYTMNGQKLDNLEKYGVSYSTKSYKCVNLQQANPSLVEKAKHIPKIFNDLKIRINNFITNSKISMNEKIELGRVK